MREFSFYKFSPSGNTTLFLMGSCPDSQECSRLCREALDHESVWAEQAGFADIEAFSLNMAAGEFCANACRAFGALLDLLQYPCGDYPDHARDYSMSISGMDKPVSLSVKGCLPQWEVKATFNLDNSQIYPKTDDTALIELPGISHLLLECGHFPTPENLPELAAKFRSAHNLEKKDACGIVWWRQNGQELQIWPHVHVQKAGTSMLETSCGSASLALSLYLHSRSQAAKFLILQPGGQKIAVELDNQARTVSLGGNVALRATGKIWL